MPTPSPSAEDDPNSDIELDAEPDPILVEYYTEHLYRHNSEVRFHLLGIAETAALESKPSYYAPNICWTTEEKDRFFHALSVHSRLRPDLIAEDIGTKSLAAVCAYIDMLEEGLAERKKLGQATIDDAASTQDLYLVARDHFPPALEVSEKWEAFEEKLAEAVISKEPDMIAEGIQKARDEETRVKQFEIRAPRGAGRLADNTRDREGEKMRKKMLKEWRDERKKVWRQEDVLGAMNGPLMRAIDMLLREQAARELLPHRSRKQGCWLCEHL